MIKNLFFKRALGGFVAALFMFFLASANAQEASPAPDEEDPFAQEEVVVQGSTGDESIRETFLKSEGVSLSGSYSGTVGITGTWDDPWGGEYDLFAADRAVLDPGSSVSLGFSAKPETDLSFYGEARAAYPFADSNGAPNISIFKLYSKFSWNDLFFFSFGKQPLKWGQGYFFAPANDILSLGAVDYANPDAEREGPLSLRTQVPLFGSLVNAYLFLISDPSSDEPFETAVAPKVELSLKGIELALAGYYKKSDQGRIIASASWAKDELSAFGEGLVKFGSDKYFIVKEERTVDLPEIPSPIPNAPPLVPASTKTFEYRIVERPDDYFFTGTLGLIYRKTWEKKLGLSVVGQYLFDGEGQANVSLDDAAKALMDRMDPRYPETDDPAIDPSAMAQALAKFGSRLGQHYGAVSVSASKILDSDFSFSAFALANLADLSGWVKPQLSWQIFDRMSVSAFASFSFGDGGDEYTNMGGVYKALQGISADPVTHAISYTEANLTPPMQLGLSFSLGSGSF